MEMRTIWKIVFPLAFLAVGVMITGWLISLRKTPPKELPKTLPPLVRAVAAHPKETRLSVHTHGTVLPHVDTTLVPQVSGRVVAVAPSFQKGGFFEKDEVLIRIDRTDYELAVAQAEARVAQARVQVSREQAEAELAKREWEKFGKGNPEALTLREPQLAEAKANLASAEAALKLAQLNLERTEIKSPFAGRIWEKSVDVGQFVSAGTPLARIYATDFAEVRLPLPLDELRFVSIPLGDSVNGGASVVLRADIGGKKGQWTGAIVRTEGEIDSRTRMIHAVARIDDPYGRKSKSDQPPLMVGLFVSAEILGSTVRAVALPRSALRGADRVLVIDSDDAFRFRTVSVLRRETDRALIDSGLLEGDRVCISTIEIATDGMKVRVQMEDRP